MLMIDLNFSIDFNFDSDVIDKKNDQREKLKLNVI